MPFQEKRTGLTLRADEIAQLHEIAGSRSKSYARVTRARILLAYAGGKKSSAITTSENLDRAVVERCIGKALSGGIATALKDLQRTGRRPIITSEDKMWAVDLACFKPFEHGIRDRPLDHLHARPTSEGTRCRGGLPFVRLEGEKRSLCDPPRGPYMSPLRELLPRRTGRAVLGIYREVQQIADGEIRGKKTAIFYDEKLGIKAIAPMAPHRAPVPGLHGICSKDNRYTRQGALSLLVGIDLHDGHILGVSQDSQGGARQREGDGQGAGRRHCEAPVPPLCEGGEEAVLQSPRFILWLQWVRDVC